MTNLGVIGLDSFELGWLRRVPHAHDIPGLDVVLTGVNLATADPREGASGDEVLTGAFAPFGTPTEPGRRVAAGLPCTAAVMRCALDGSGLELVAWGLRNAFGLGFLPDGRLLALDQGSDDRGSRPVGAVPELLFEVRQGAWYGWPDFIGGVPVTDPVFTPERGPRPEFLLANHDELPAPERPLLALAPHTAATRFASVPPDSPRFAGHLVIALFGDEAPMTAPAGSARAGRHLVRVDPADWSVHGLWPRSALHRPIDVGFNPVDGALYILDFGDFEMSERECPGPGRHRHTVAVGGLGRGHAVRNPERGDRRRRFRQPWAFPG